MLPHRPKRRSGKKIAQTYFAVQTRKQELMEERLRGMERLQAREKLEATETELSRLIYERGVDGILRVPIAESKIFHIQWKQA